jgi:D-alanyl-D-alanine carboxypeptidase (penicillin-binding protein 5/6)
MKKILLSVFIILLVMTTNTIYGKDVFTESTLLYVSENVKEPNVQALCAVAVDLDSGKILYEKNALLRNAPASTTKMMTAIVTVENSNLDDIVTISRKAAGMDGSVMGLYTGQQLTVKELLYGLLLCSGNDAAVALAEHIGGDMESFARLMNEKAEELGLKDTHFVNSHGLDAEGHYSNAYELAKIGAYALSHDIIKEIVGTKFAHIAGRNLTNTNELLGYYEGVYGLKTGFTNKAGRCLVTSAKRGDLNVITVVLNSPTKKARTISTIRILDYVFDNFDYFPIVSKGERFADVTVKKGIQREVDLVVREDIRMLLAKKDVAGLKYTCIFPESLTAPVIQGTEVGKLKITRGNEVLLDIPLVAAEDVGVRNTIYYLKEIGKNLMDLMR